MANKTALQELMEWMNEESQVIPVDPYYVYQKAEELLVKEKEQLMKANLDGFIQAYEFVPGEYVKTSEQYYNETYGKQDN
jgi:uncharacterized protein YbcC (UPF0753/DUF2309 family)